MDDKKFSRPRRPGPDRGDRGPARPRDASQSRNAEELLEIAEGLEEEGRALLAHARKLQRLAERMEAKGSYDRGERADRGGRPQRPTGSAGPRRPRPEGDEGRPRRSESGEGRPRRSESGEGEKTSRFRKSPEGRERSRSPRDDGGEGERTNRFRKSSEGRERSRSPRDEGGRPGRRPSGAPSWTPAGKRKRPE